MNARPRASSRVDAILFAGVCLLFLADAWHLLDGVRMYSPDRVPGLMADRCALIVGVAALLILRVMHRSPATSWRFDAAIGALCGALFFSRSLGMALADPRNIQWLMRGDWAAHYAGWASFRAAAWTWPPGADPDAWFPVGTSVVFTDSLPLVAIPLKLFRGLLPEPFQYIGLAVAANFVLQGVCAALLMRRGGARPAGVLSGCLLFLFAPVLLWRIGHDTLTAQWLILAAFLLYFRDRPMPLAREVWPWIVIAFVAAAIHPYLPPMLLAIAAAYWTRRIHIDRMSTWIDGSFALSSMIAVTMLVWWLAGAFTIPPGDASGGISSGIYTANVLTFVNSSGFSRIVPSIPGVPIEQWEGAAYLGLGLMTLLIALAVHWIVHRFRRSHENPHWPLVVVVVLLGLFAVSTSVRVGPWLLTDWKPQVPIVETYRASGRFIWVPFYGLLLFAAWRTMRIFPRGAPFVLAATLALQMWDFAPIHLHFAALRSGVSWPAPEKPLQSPAWDALLADRHHVTMLPPVACGKQAGPYLPFELLAARHAATFNSGYIARWDSKATERYCGQLRDDIAAQHYSRDDVYIVGPDLIETLKQTDHMQCHLLDTYTACTFDGP